MKKWIFLFLVVLGGCTSAAPLQEYTLARTALEAAQSAGAAKYAPGLWFKAEENYREGEGSFKKGQFDDALNFFNESIDYSEKAENKAKFDKKRLGEELQ